VSAVRRAASVSVVKGMTRMIIHNPKGSTHRASRARTVRSSLGLASVFVTSCVLSLAIAGSTAVADPKFVPGNAPDAAMSTTAKAQAPKLNAGAIVLLQATQQPGEGSFDPRIFEQLPSLKKKNTLKEEAPFRAYNTYKFLEHKLLTPMKLGEPAT